ncbi:MAG TPA: ATP-binding protein [Mucilaginibacter sp.]|jgi:AAA15 family ATPase/GTPase
MIPGKGTLKPFHKSQPVKGISTLKAAVVFGANASGKSNLIKAIDFGRNLVLKGTKSDQLIEFQNFRLDSKTLVSNSRIEYEIQHNGKNYAYGFVFNKNQIDEEWLFEINKKNDIKIFERNAKKTTAFDLEPLLKKNKKDEEKQFLQFIAKSTPNNQLFLTEVRTRKVKENVKDISDLINVIDWFQNVLNVVFPDDKYKLGVKSELRDGSKLQSTFEELLEYFDTGINGICLEKVDFENVEVPFEIKKDITDDLTSAKNEDFRVALVSPTNATYFFSRQKNKIVAEKFMTKHKIAGSKKDTLFDTSDESDGTNRIIDFIPVIIDLLQGEKVFFIDEMERSLHPNLIYDLFDLFLAKCENINSQLIIASHESSLLTQKLLRKDEIWFIVKDKGGSSHMHSLEEYNIRFDKEIRRNYLQGRFKAVPRIGNRDHLTVLP